MSNPVGQYLNNHTMYQVALHVLGSLAALAFLFSVLGQLPYAPLSLVLSLGMLLAVCVGTNRLFAKLMGTSGTDAAALITAGILFFLVFPPATAGDLAAIAAVGVIAMGSKYVLAYRGRHLFNPAAISVLIASYAFGFGASWWIATPIFLPFTLVAAALLIRKVRRVPMALTFTAVALLTIVLFNGAAGDTPLGLIEQAFASWPLVFFAGFMLTEPVTTPGTRRLQLAYAAIVGFLFGFPFRFGPVYASPELALVLGNLFSAFVGMKGRLVLTFKEKLPLTSDLFELVFVPDRPFAFAAGQYLDWMLPHSRVDARGIRRYFTIASAPTQSEVRLGIKIPEKSSSFKQTLAAMKPGARVYAGRLAGDFVLPKDPTQPLVFIAGGIGITPFRSMIQYLVDKNEKRDVLLVYLARTPKDFAYASLFDEAARVGVKTIYIANDAGNSPGWTGRTGMLTEAMMMELIPDHTKRRYYLSGPNAMVNAYKKTLNTLGVPKAQINTDYFPGY